MLTVSPITLVGDFVRLEPLSQSHVPDLTKMALDADIWRYLLYPIVGTEDQMRAWVEDILSRQAKGADLPFAVIHLETGRAVGATRYLEIRPEHRALEIGGTWYGVAYQRTVVNTECKYLLLRNAFEQLGCVRVQFKTDLRNVRSQKALERIGAVQEGILRNHMITPDGYVRDSVYYSIIEAEWPTIKSRLEQKMIGSIANLK